MTKVIFFLQLIQDVNILAPVMRAARLKNVPMEIWMTDRLAAQSTKPAACLQKERFSFRVIPRWKIFLGFKIPFQGVFHLVTASESSAPPHRAAYWLARWAGRRGIATWTLQHGFENVGLTYSDVENPIENIKFQSQHILIWPKLSELHSRIPQSTRVKCEATGRPSLDAFSPNAEQFKFRFIAIFENLHWRRYAKKERDSFIKVLCELSLKFPNQKFVVVPHPNGQWSAQSDKLKNNQFANLIIAESNSEEWNSQGIIAQADAVLTTPSTIALDAAIAHKPCAVLNFGTHRLDKYQPLSILTSESDVLKWLEFLELEETRAPLLECSRQFVKKATVSTDSEDLILNRILNS